MKSGSVWTRITALLCAGLFVVAVSGCGGGNDSGDETTAAPDSGPSLEEQGIETAEDREAVAGFIETFVESARSGNPNRFCGLLEPGQREAAFGSLEECAEYFRPLLKRAEVRNSYQIENLEFDGDTAEITFKNGGGTGVLVKTEGQWYVQVPEELADQANQTQ